LRLADFPAFAMRTARDFDRPVLLVVLDRGSPHIGQRFTHTGKRAHMKTLQIMAVAPVLVMPATSIADDAQAARRKAREESLEALDTYKKVLKNELRELDSRVETLEPPGGKSLRNERAIAKEKLEDIAEEAKHAWESNRARMDSVIDDLKRQIREPLAQR
jgi:hypothetical protein